MSIAATRAAIAAAANAVAGVKVTPKRRQALSPLQGFVVLTRRVRPPNKFGWMDTWQVWVALPQDTGTADEWTDENLPELMDALKAELIVTSAFLADLQPTPGAPVVPGLVIEGARAG